jgi:hypothetical protein
VNAVQFSSPQPSGVKNKTKNKPKKINNQNENPKTQTQPHANENQRQHKAKFPCLICAEYHYTRVCPHREEVAKLFNRNSQSAALTHPFPHQQSLDAQNPAPPQGWNQGNPPSKDASSSAHIYMFNGVDLNTLTTTYDTPPGKPDKDNVTNGTAMDPPSTLVTPLSGPLQIKKPSFDSILCLPKRTIKKSTFNPNSRAAQNYNIVEDLAQAFCTMSSLKVLQHFPSQHRNLLETIEAMDPESSNNITLNMDNFKSWFFRQLSFQIDVVVHNQHIHRMILDEGASTCVMYLACWKCLKSPGLNQSPTMLKEFDGIGFWTHGLLQSLAIQLGGKTVSIDVEVVDAPLNYNLLLGRSWFYAMTAVASSVFQCVQFPCQGKIVTIDQLYYYTPDARTQTTNNIPFLGDSNITYESVRVGLLKYSSLMGTFPTPLPSTTQHITKVNMILTMVHQSLESSDPWIIPSPLEFDSLGDTMPLSPTKVEYDTIQSTSPSPDDQHLLASNFSSLPSCLDSLSSTFDYILHIFPSDESIMEMTSIEEAPWDDNHHRSSFLPCLDEIEKYISSIFPTDIFYAPQSLILT